MPSLVAVDPRYPEINYRFLPYRWQIEYYEFSLINVLLQTGSLAERTDCRNKKCTVTVAVDEAMKNIWIYQA